MGVLLQRPARPRAADRVGRLSGPSEGEVMSMPTVRLKADAPGAGVRILAVLLLVLVVSGFGRTVAAQEMAGDLDPGIVKLVSAVSEERLGAILKKLESFETRSTLSSTTSTTRGIGAARQWILDEMKSYSPKLQVSFDTYQVVAQGRITRDVELRNVMAVLPGRSPRRIYVSGHYDTVARPGGQGTANAAGPADPDARTVPPADPNPPRGNLAPGVNGHGRGTPRRSGSSRKGWRIRRRASWRGSSSAGAAATCRRTRCGRWRGPTGSAAAATIRPTTRSDSPPSASASRGRTSRGSTTCATRSR